jgi:hypothetical protein
LFPEKLTNPPTGRLMRLALNGDKPPNRIKMP